MIDKVITGFITLGCLGACVTLWIMERDIPAPLLGVTGVALGRYLPMPGGLKKD